MMSTLHKREPEEIAAVEYLAARAASEKIPGLLLRVDHSVFCPVTAFAAGRTGVGNTISEAIADLRRQMEKFSTL